MEKVRVKIPYAFSRDELDEIHGEIIAALGDLAEKKAELKALRDQYRSEMGLIEKNLARLTTCARFKQEFREVDAMIDFDYENYRVLHYIEGRDEPVYVREMTGEERRVIRINFQENSANG